MVIRDIAILWKDSKKQYVKESTYYAYCLLLTNHILPFFGAKDKFVEDDVQQFVLNSLEGGLSEKTIKDIIVVIKMIQKFGAKNKMMPNCLAFCTAFCCLHRFWDRPVDAVHGPVEQRDRQPRSVLQAWRQDDLHQRPGRPTCPETAVPGT